MRNFLLLFLIFITSCGPAIDPAQMRRADNATQNSNQTTTVDISAADVELAKQIEEIAKEANGRVGVYAEMIDGDGTVSLNANDRFAMQSVVKVPIAMAVLKQVDEGMVSLDQKITISKDEYVPSGMYSPIRDKTKSADGYLLSSGRELKELIAFAVSESDGTAADVLQRVAGGAADVQSFIELVNIDAMKVKYTHKEFSNNNERQNENWASPRATVALLKTLLRSSNGDENVSTGSNSDPVLSKPSAHLMLKLMTETPTGPNRLKGMLPKDTVVIHKTGSSGTVDGKTAATNDVGLIQLPNGKYFAIAVFVGDSTADDKTREAVIAKIAKAVWDKWA